MPAFLSKLYQGAAAGLTLCSSEVASSKATVPLPAFSPSSVVPHLDFHAGSSPACAVPEGTEALPSGFCFACACSLPPYCAAVRERKADNMTMVLVVSQDAIVVFRVQAYQRRAARAAAIVASSCRSESVNMCRGGNDHCDISQCKHR